MRPNGIRSEAAFSDSLIPPNKWPQGYRIELHEIVGRSFQRLEVIPEG